MVARRLLQALAGAVALASVAACAQAPATSRVSGQPPVRPEPVPVVLPDRVPGPPTSSAAASASEVPAGSSPTLIATTLLVPPPSGASSSLVVHEVIPWLAAPAVRIQDPDLNAPITKPVDFRSCTATDLSVQGPPGWDPMMGNDEEFLRLRNTSSTPCSLWGAPRALTDVLAGGVRRRIVPTVGGFGRGLDAVANLHPGETATTQLSQPTECATTAKRQTVTSYELELPDGSTLPVVKRLGSYGAPDPSCSLTASLFGSPHHQVPEPTHPTDPLQVTTTMPDTARAGSTIHFLVTLINTTGQAVPLVPCPTYDEVVNAFHPGGRVDGHDVAYHLNCDGHSAIEPGQSLTFAMQVPAPDAPGFAKWSWWLQPTSAGRGGALTVVS